MQQLAVLLLLACVLLASVVAMPPVQVVASVKGKKYDVTAESVEEFTRTVEEVAGLEAGQQSVLFRGKVLKPTDRFDDLGISAGDVLNVVKGRKQRAAEEAVGADGGVSTTKSATGGLGSVPSMADLQSMSAEAMKNPEEVQKAMQQMDQLLDSDFVDEYFSDDEKLEKARLDMLEKLDQYEQMMPGFKAQAQEIASSPEKWKEAMSQAKQQIVTMKRARDEARSKGGKAQPTPTSPPSTKGVADSIDDVPEGEE